MVLVVNVEQARIASVTARFFEGPPRERVLQQIICNAVFLVVGRVEHMQRSSGIVDDELVYLQVGNIDGTASGSAAAELTIEGVRDIGRAVT